MMMGMWLLMALVGCMNEWSKNDIPNLCALVDASGTVTV
jgi:hypothetical protein